MPGKLMLCPPADKEQVENALNIAGVEKGDHRLKSHRSIADGILVMNYCKEGVNRAVLYGCFVNMSLVIMHVI